MPPLSHMRYYQETILHKTLGANVSDICVLTCSPSGTTTTKRLEGTDENGMNAGTKYDKSSSRNSLKGGGYGQIGRKQKVNGFKRRKSLRARQKVRKTYFLLDVLHLLNSYCKLVLHPVDAF